MQSHAIVLLGTTGTAYARHEPRYIERVIKRQTKNEIKETKRTKMKKIRKNVEVNEYPENNSNSKERPKRGRQKTPSLRQHDNSMQRGRAPPEEKRQAEQK